MREFTGKAYITLSDDRVIHLYNKKGDKVGIIDFSKDKITFEGNLEASADSLFSLLKFIIEPFSKK